ncbi:hypothetical protein KUTeg_001772 [Tegillarca granosa]|uniref:Ig-like domain-containing protein n=1 Tax=Tegillarca granosa TaxID=220873 RepID=A0ABQ9FV77_TEGGR|nr:hypothetical protein KUTeg_001772 [Tegillarca granosa]
MYHDSYRMVIKFLFIWLASVVASTKGVLYWEQGTNLYVKTADSVNLTCVGVDNNYKSGDLSINVTVSKINTTLYGDGDESCGTESPLFTCKQYNNTFFIHIRNITTVFNKAEFHCMSTVDNSTINDTIKIFVDTQIEINPTYNITVKDSEMLNFICTLNTVNLSQGIEWYIAENPVKTDNILNNVTSDTLYSYLSFIANPDDNGKEIYCKSIDAENQKIHTSTTTIINVLYGPAYEEQWFDIQTSELFVLRGDMAPNVTCSTDCNPPCGFYWTRNNHFIFNRTLSVGKIISYRKTGEYTCHAWSPYGNGSKTLTIEEVYGPLGSIRLDTNTTAFEVLEGSDVQNIRCFAECKPNCTFQWIKSNGFEYTGDDLMLTNVSKESAGKYFCHARNDYGSANTSFSLTVYHGPGQSLKFDVKTTDVIIIEGMEMNVTCIASCTPECDVWWTRDQNVTISQNVLPVHDVLTYVPGNFTCSAWNEYGAANMTIAVDINYPAKNMSLDQHTTTLNLKEGDLVPEFTCNAECRPLCNYIWLHNDVQVGNGAILNFTDRATPNTTGIYTCVASNIVGKSNITKSIQVQYTRLSIIHGNVKCPNGNRTDITLTCKAESFPSSFTFLKWHHMYQNQHVRFIHGTVTGNLNVLKIPFCGYQDTGTYICNVEFGERLTGEPVSRQIEVDVEDKPVISNYNNVDISPDKSTLNIAVIYFSTPTPSKTSWFKDGEELVLTDRRRPYTSPAELNLTFYRSVVNVTGFVSKLEITKPVLSDNGRYTLVIYNPRGVAKFTVDISDFTLGKFEYGLIFGGAVLLATLPVIFGLYCHHKRYKKKKSPVRKREKQRSKRRFLSFGGNGQFSVRLPSIYDNINDGREAKSILFRWFGDRRRSDTTFKLPF